MRCTSLDNCIYVLDHAFVQEMLSVVSMIQADAQFISDLKTKTEQAVQVTIVATRIIDGFKNSYQHSTDLNNYASFPLE